MAALSQSPATDFDGAGHRQAAATDVGGYKRDAQVAHGRGLFGRRNRA